MRAIRTLALIALVPVLGGCHLVRTIYTYHQVEMPRGTYTVQLKIAPNENLVMLEDWTSESVGAPATYMRDYWQGCQYFDEDNWACGMPMSGERAVMNHGQFTHYLQGETRNYTRTFKFDTSWLEQL